jgi:hypothetical protein
LPKRQWEGKLTDTERREQFRLIYDYIKFHIGLYLSTPAVMALLADAFGVKKCPSFKYGLTGMIVLRRWSCWTLHVAAYQ